MAGNYKCYRRKETGFVEGVEDKNKTRARESRESLGVVDLQTWTANTR
jgi:hypothetical protein